MTLGTWPRALSVAVGVLLWLMAASAAAAHAELVSSVPAKGSTIAPTAAPIVLSFSEAMKSSSHADIIAPSGTKLGTATLDPKDNTKLTYTPPGPLGPGSWTVKWTSVALDGHLLRDEFRFTVTAAATVPPSSATASPPPTATTAATPAASPTPATATSSDTNVIVPVIAALLVIGLLASALLRNRRPTNRR
jgi:copper resistance protein C